MTTNDREALWAVIATHDPDNGHPQDQTKCACGKVIGTHDGTIVTTDPWNHLLDELLAAGFTRQPQPHVVETAEVTTPGDCRVQLREASVEDLGGAGFMLSFSMGPSDGRYAEVFLSGDNLRALGFAAQSAEVRGYWDHWHEPEHPPTASEPVTHWRPGSSDSVDCCGKAMSDLPEDDMWSHARHVANCPALTASEPTEAEVEAAIQKAEAQAYERADERFPDNGPHGDHEFRHRDFSDGIDSTAEAVRAALRAARGVRP